jgi:hypothetical protein
MVEYYSYGVDSSNGVRVTVYIYVPIDRATYRYHSIHDVMQNAEKL